MINNRQSSRRRGRGSNNGQRSSGGSGSQGQRDSGNRIDSRARGNAAQLLEKYKNMARDAQMQGDRVNTEHYLQFADHYFRVLSDSRARQDDHRPIRPVDDFDGSDEEYGDEGEPIRANEQADNRPPQNGNRDHARNDGHQRNDNRNDGQRRDYQPREDQRREYQSRDQPPRDQPREPRDQQPREYQQREQAPREAQREQGQREDGRRADSRRAREDTRREPVEQAVQADEQPYRNGVANDVDVAVAAPVKAERKPATRTRKAAAPIAPPAGESHGMDADRLPPSLGASLGIVSEGVIASEGEPIEVPAPKKRRGRPPASESKAS